MREAPDVNDAAKLERRYRRLLRAYPRGYRRERGDEMLTTLVDSAADRDRSPVGERTMLVLRGLWLRLSAETVPVRVMAVLAAVIVGVLGAVGGALAGWQSAGDLPSPDAASRIAATAVPDAEAGQSHDALFGWSGYVDESLLYLGGDDYAAGFREFTLDHKADNGSLLRSARHNLAAAGWDVEPASATRYGGEFTATRDGLLVTVSTGADAKAASTSVHIERASPTPVPILTVAGLILGALGGWAAIVWLEQLMARWGGVRKSILAGPLVAAGVLLAIPTLFNLYALALSFMDYPKPTAIWIGYVWNVPGLLTLLAAVALAYGVVKALAAMLWRRPAHQAATG